MIRPAKPPQQSLSASVKLLGLPFGILGIRGYFRDSLGKPAVNDRAVYDDALFLISPFCYVAFNANTDPSKYEPGIASLKPGSYFYTLGIHGLSKPKAQQYQALVQAAPVTVLRDGGKEETGMFGINIHRGGLTQTSSAGCQTIPPDQWPSFIELVKSQLEAMKATKIIYVLLER